MVICSKPGQPELAYDPVNAENYTSYSAPASSANGRNVCGSNGYNFKSGYADDVPGTPGANVAADSLISIYGSNLASTTAVATDYPWPTELGGTTVVLNGIDKPCRVADFTSWHAHC